MTKAAANQPTRAQAIEAVRQTDCDGADYWFCARTGNRIQTHPDSHYGYFCSGCNAVAPRIRPVRSFRS